MTKEKILQAYDDQIITAKRRDYLLKTIEVKEFSTQKMPHVDKAKRLNITIQTYYRMLKR